MTHLEFTHGERTFHCHTATSTATPDTLWWWVSVTGEAAKYAAFRAEKRDTSASLRKRIVAYYDELVERRTRPATPPLPWSQRRSAAAAQASAAATEVPAPAVELSTPTDDQAGVSAGS